MGRAAILFAISLSGLACATTKATQPDGEDERPARDVAEVHVSGNRLVETDDLVEGLANHPPRGIFPFRTVATYEPLTLELDKRRIESAYKERGFFSASVLRAKVDGAGERGVIITFEVDEGLPSTLDSVEVQGAPSGAAVNAEALIEVADLEVSEAFEYAEYLKAKEKIKGRLVAQGFAHAEVDGTVEVHPDKETAIARFTVVPGPVAIFGRVTVDGLSRTDETLILNRIAWAEGERFDPLKLEETKGRLYETGLVGNVRFDWPTEGKPQVLDIVVRASEGTRHEVRLGGGIGIEQAHYEARVRAMYSHRNFLDPKATLRLNLRPGLAFFRAGGGFAGFNIEAGAEVDREDFLAPRWKLVTGVEYKRTELEAFAFQGPSAKVAIGRPVLDERLMVQFTTQYHQYSFPRIDEAITPDLRRLVGLYEPLPFATLEPSVIFDGRDDAFSPTKGMYAALRLEVGQVFATEGSTFMKLTPEIRGYLKLRRRMILAGKLRAGSSAFGFTPIPITQRYFAGGAESQRGFGYRRLSPQVTNATNDHLPLGGEAMLETSAELRVDLFRLFDNWFGAVVFIDGADVGYDWADIKVPNLHWAVGPGLRYDTPVGPIRIDVGFRLNRTGPGEPDPDSKFAFHLSLGEAF